MSGENWHEERDRLAQLLKGIESGNITRMHEGDLPELQATTPENIAVLKVRLAQLNARLGDHEAKDPKARPDASSAASEQNGPPPATDAT